MSARAAATFGFGLGVFLGAPLVAPFALYLFERHLRREGLREWASRGLWLERG